MKVIAKFGAAFVPMAVPQICRKNSPQKVKTLLVSTSSSSLQMVLLEGILSVRLNLFNMVRITFTPSFMGMFVYRLVTSNVTSKAPGGRGPKSSKMFKKWEVSLMYDLPLVAISFRKKSTNCDILSEGHLFPEVMGLPGGGVMSLWILGSM